MPTKPVPSGKKSKFGRPTKGTPDAKKKIIDLISSGVPFNVAAQCAGIADKTSFYRWIASDPDFKDRLSMASAEAEARNVITISKASAKAWQAAAWLLERGPKTRERWAKDMQTSMPGERVSLTISSPTSEAKD